MPRTASAWSACTPRSRSRTSPHKRAAHAGDHGARTRRHRPQGLRAGHRDRQGGNRQRRQRDRGPRLQEQLATGDGYSSLQMSRGKYVSPARTNRPVIRLSSNHSLQASVSTRTRRPSTAMRRPGTMDPRYCTVTASPTTGVRREGGVTVRPNRWIGRASPWSRRQSPPYGPVSVPSRRRRRASRERHVVEGPAWRGGNRTRDPRVMRRTRRRWKGARGTKRVHQPVFGPPSRSTGSSAHPADLQGFRVLACRRSHARFRP